MDRDLRQKSVNAMASIYHGADLVLVLDAGLMQLALDVTFEPFPFLVAISESVWNARSWTFQEYILPQRCCFQFANGPIFLGSTPGTSTRGPTIFWNNGPGKRDFFDSQLPVSGTKTEFLLAMLPMRHNLGTGGRFFQSVWNGLASRSTSQHEDQCMILANSLRKDYGSLQSRPKLHRVPSIILGLKEISLAIFYSTTATFLESQSNGWIPTSVGTEPFVKAPSLEIREGNLQSKTLDFSANVNAHSTALYFFRDKIPVSQGLLSLRTGTKDVLRYLCPFPQGASCEALAQIEACQLCMIMQDDMSGLVPRQQAALFRILSHEKSVVPTQLYLTFICPARLETRSDADALTSSLSTDFFYTSERYHGQCALTIHYGMLARIILYAEAG